MRAARATAVGAALALLLAAPGAGASGGCLVATDPAGDADGRAAPPAGGPSLPADAAFDLRRLEVSVDRGVLRAVLEVGRSDVQEHVYWSVHFYDDDTRWSVSAARHADGTYFSGGGPSDADGVYAKNAPATGSVDTARGVVEVAVRLADLQLTPRTTVLRFVGATQRTVGTAGDSSTFWSSVMSPYPVDEMVGHVRFRFDGSCPGRR